MCGFLYIARMLSDPSHVDARDAMPSQLLVGDSSLKEL